jgi:aminopeptidase-like protein
MTLSAWIDEADSSRFGDEIYDLIARLYPICRSITGNGVRRTLEIISERLPVQVHEVASGTQVLDWTVPKEWNIRDAYVKNSAGERIIDFARSNLHVVGYSTPVLDWMSRDRLRNNLFSLPDRPDWIPYRTSYYSEQWGFCVSHRQFEELPDDRYEVCIDSTLTEGSLTYGEYFVPGQSSDEVLISAHICHPSLCNGRRRRGSVDRRV